MIARSIRRAALVVAGLSSALLAACGEAPESSADLSSVDTAQAAAPADRTSVEAGSLVRVRNFGENPGRLNMYLYTPARVAPNAPVVVTLHGCVQNANDYQAAGWNTLADEWGFYVVYAEQRYTNNSANCFNWAGYYGDPADITRGEGENQSIRSMVSYMETNKGIDTDRVFISGFSAGGAFAAVMLATWPEVFNAGAIMAGIPYYCADSLAETDPCMDGVKNLSAEAWGSLVRQKGFPEGYAGPYPRVSLWHGSRDSIVGVQNLTELMEQWTDVSGIDQVADAEEIVQSGANRHEHKQYQDDAGSTLVETWLVDGMDHGVAVDPQLGAFSCGSTLEPYFYDEDLCSTYLAAQFFGLQP